MLRILFVCHGNICRSPMAEFYMKDLVNRKGRSGDFYIASAATSDEECWNGNGNPVYPPAYEELRKHGIGTEENELGVREKRARQLTRRDYGQWDYIIGMDAENLRGMRRICGGDPEGKLSLLLDYTDHPRNVADPWDTRDFSAAWADISEGCSALYQQLTEPAQR